MQNMNNYYNNEQKNEPKKPLSGCYVNGLEVTVWHNKGKNGMMHTLNIRKKYKDADGKEQEQNISILLDQVTDLIYCMESSLKKAGLKSD